MFIHRSMTVKRIILALLIAIAFEGLPTCAQSTDGPCSLKFSLAERDTLGNVNVGFSPDGQKWFKKDVSKHYPNICYTEQKPNVGIWFYISISTQTQESATATTRTSPNGAGGTTSDTTVSPKAIEYPVYTLKIGRFHNGSLEVLRTFQRTKAGSANGTVSGFVHSFGNPEHDVIMDGVKWLSSTAGQVAL